MKGTPRVRARIEGRPDPPFDRFYDPVVHDLVAGGELARTRFVTLWSDTAALKALGLAKRGPLPASLAEALRADHRRLEAQAPSLAGLERLARGEAVCTVAGQQPAPLGGPLYSLHKIAAAVGLARVFEERTGIPCVPLFWMHGEDSDFAEIKSATVFDAGLHTHELEIGAEFHAEGGLVGSIRAAALEAVEAEALRRWAGLGGHDDVRSLLDRARGGARDLGEAFSALVLRLFGDEGLVVVDPRRPEFRAAARPIIDRYLARAEALAVAVREAGTWLERRVARRPLADAALESFVFEIRDGTRAKIAVADARARGATATLSPSVALRPAVQDGVFPTVAMACGAGEIGYLAQLREVFEGVEVRAAAAVPRFAATWLPAEAVELLEASGAQPWELVTGADHVLKRYAERAVPEDVRRALDQARAQANASLKTFAEAARRVDASLPQMVESARGKVDFQFARLEEGVAAKARHRLELKHPAWVRIRYALLPGEKLQERRIASLLPVAFRGRAVVRELCELAAGHARRLAEGSHEHYLLEL